MEDPVGVLLRDRTSICGKGSEAGLRSDVMCTFESSSSKAILLGNDNGDLNDLGFGTVR